MVRESVRRLAAPVPIDFDQAIMVVPGLAVSGTNLLLLGRHHEHEHEHERDHNRRSATLHVLADTLASVYAIVALVASKSVG